MKVVFLKIQENIDIVSGLCMLNIISPSLVSVISWKLQNFQINFYTYIFSSSLNENFIKIILFFASKQLFATLSLKKKSTINNEIRGTFDSGVSMKTSNKHFVATQQYDYKTFESLQKQFKETTTVYNQGQSNDRKFCGITISFFFL